MARALVLEDNDAERSAVAELVQQAGFEPLEAESIERAKRIIADEPLDIALIDLELPDGSGLELMPLLDELPHVDVVVISGTATVDSVSEAFRSGIVDLITKPVDTGRLRDFLETARRTASLLDEVRKLRGELRSFGRFGRMTGNSMPMQRVYDLIGKVAPTSSTVFVVGETGTGKELVAATVHELSKRADGPYLTVNCGAIQPNLIESELFGHEKGAFTGADRRRRGLFERADRGTVFLDEITEMPPELQVKLLRVLESQEFQRVGGEERIRSDVRVIAASNRDPEQAMRDGMLREDLMYRLRVFPIHLPPLRERGGDVLLLADRFLREKNDENGTRKRLSSEVLEELSRRDWPGNVRELRNAIDRAYIMADKEIEADHLVDEVQGEAATHAEDTVDVQVGQSIAEAERRLILATLDAIPNKKKAATVLGISLKTLYTRLNKYGL